jgi:AcrR family transcriptional regulator
MSTTLTRSDRALVTRRRMVRAAYDLFCERGYLGTTISEVASRAGVAVPTIYYTFGTKVVLLEESLGAAILGFDRWRQPPTDPDISELLPWHDWWAPFHAAATSEAAFEIFFTHGVSILERVAPLAAALHGAAGDPEAAEMTRVSERRRVTAYREAIRLIAGKPGGLRPGLTPAKATDILVVLFSAELYQSIRTGPAWSAPRTATFLHDLLSAQLLGH